MTNQPNEASIFNAARAIASQEDRLAFLDETCGDDLKLRGRVDQLLAAFHEESQFLEQPAQGLAPTIAPDNSRKDLAISMDAGFAATFGDESAVVVGNTNHSVLKSIGATLNQVPRVSLREPREEGDEPIQRPSSPEIPDQSSDSRYQLHGEIARGGMGAVLRGRDTDLGRDLAVKVLLDTHKDKPEVVQRFVEEAQIGGQLQHPGIAPVYELGQFADQRPFFSMKLVKGDTLSKLLSNRDDPAADRSKLIGIFEQVCQTMAYAHSRGVIHRDLKPANIMVGAFGEVQVMDWGLAKVLSVGGVADEKTARRKQNGETMIQTMRSVGSDAPGTVGSVGSETQMGSVMGTPAYMPPEQALGEIDMLDQRADVFGLGAILAEILTGKPPYVANDGTQVYRMASRGKLDDCFSRLDECGADAELVSLAKQCLEVEPADRPQDASALAEQVTGYLESVETKLRESEIELAGEAARVVEQRKRFLVTLGLSMAALTILLAGIVATAWQAREAKRQTRVAQDARNEATEERDNAREAEQQAIVARDVADNARKAERTARVTSDKARLAEKTAKRQQKDIAIQRRRELYAADMQLADQLYNGQNGEQKLIEEILDSWIPVDDQEDLREFSWRYQWTRLHRGASISVSDCKGATITPANKLVVADADGLHEVDASGNKHQIIGWKLEYPWPWFSPDGRWVASKFESGVELYHIESRKKVLSLPQTRCSFSADGKYFAAWKGGAKVASLAEYEDAIPVWELDGENANPVAPLVIGALNPLPEFANLLKLGSDGKSFLRRLGAQVIARLNGNPEPVSWLHRGAPNCAWSPDGAIIASAFGGTVELRLKSAVSDKQPLDNLTISTHGKFFNTVRFSPDGNLLAAGGNDGTIDLWDVSSLVDAIEQFETQNQERTGEKNSNSTTITALPEPRLIQTIKAFTSGMSTLDMALSFSNDSSVLAAQDDSGNIKSWDLKNVPGKYQMDRITKDLYGWTIPWKAKSSGGDFPYFLAKIPANAILEGNPVASERILSIFDPEKGDWFNRDGMETWHDFAILLQGSRGSEIRLKLENAEGKLHEVKLLRQHQRLNQSPRSFSVAFDPDGNNVVVGDYTIGATRLNLKSRGAIRYPNRGMSAAYSPDGRLVAIGSAFAISIRDVETDKELYQLDSFIDADWNARALGGHLAFSPDGKYLAHVSGYRYNTTRSELNVWRTSDFKKVRGGSLHQEDSTMSALVFSPDSSQLLVGGSNGVVRIWNTSDWTQEGPLSTFAPIGSLAISSDGHRLVVGSYVDIILGGSIGVWDLKKKQTVHVLGSPRVGYLALSPDDRTLAVGGMNHNVVLWDMKSGKRLQTIQAHSESIFGVAFSQDGNRLATLSTDGALYIWDAAGTSEIEKDPDTITKMFQLGMTRWRQQRFAEGEKRFVRAMQLNQNTGHLSESEVAVKGQYVRMMMKLSGYWQYLVDGTGNWPSFTQQPPSKVGTRIGEDVRLTANVCEGDWSFQWYHNGIPIDGATSPGLELKNVVEADFGSYRIEVLGEDYMPIFQKNCTATTFLFDEREEVMKGFLSREVFTNFCGPRLRVVEAMSILRNEPSDFISAIRSWENPTTFSNGAEADSGYRISGFVVPPTTGDYVFYLASDDQSELFLSSDETAENYKSIATVKNVIATAGQEATTHELRAWGDSPSSVSEPVHLEAGKRYAIMGIMSNGNPGDDFAVTWKMPGDKAPQTGAPPIPGKYLECEPE